MIQEIEQRSLTNRFPKVIMALTRNFLIQGKISSSPYL
jgi:hypothetical protein